MTKPDMFSGVACSVSVQANVKIRKYGRKAVISWSCENPEAIEAIEVIKVIQKYNWPTDPGPVNPITLKNIAVTAGATRSYYTLQCSVQEKSDFNESWKVLRIWKNGWRQANIAGTKLSTRSRTCLIPSDSARALTFVQHQWIHTNFNFI